MWHLVAGPTCESERTCQGCSAADREMPRMQASAARPRRRNLNSEREAGGGKTKSHRKRLFGRQALFPPANRPSERKSERLVLWPSSGRTLPVWPSLRQKDGSKQAATNNLEAETMTSLWRRLLVARDRSGDGASTIRARLLCLVLSCRAPTADAIDDCKKNIKNCRSQRGIASAETSLRLSF